MNNILLFIKRNLPLAICLGLFMGWLSLTAICSLLSALPKVEIINLSYLVFFLGGIILFLCIYFFLKKRSQETQYYFLLIWLFMGFALHFLKQFFPEYSFPQDLHKSTFENICAVSTLVFPFIFMIKKDCALHDFMYFIGVLGGLAGCIYPTEAMGEAVMRFETWRFYFCHFSLCSVPLLSAMLGIHRPNIKRFWAIPLIFMAYETVIMLNEAMLVSTGLIEGGWEIFFDIEKRNNAFVFGPTSDMGGFGRFIASFCPDFMKQDIFMLFDGKVFYWPVVWLLFPSIILFIPVYIFICSPFYFKNMLDFCKVQLKTK